MICLAIFSGGSTPVPPTAAGRQVILGQIFINLTVQISCFITIYTIIWADTQLSLSVFRYLLYPIFNV